MRPLLIGVFLFCAGAFNANQAIGQDFYGRYTYGWRGSSPYIYGGYIHPPADYRIRSWHSYYWEPPVVEYHHHEHYHYHAAPVEIPGPVKPFSPRPRRWLW